MILCNEKRILIIIIGAQLGMQKLFLSENRRTRFQEQISQRKRRQIMQEKRVQFQKKVISEKLKDLMGNIDKKIFLSKRNQKDFISEQIITENELRSLLELVAQEQGKAVMYLGNLLIDDYVNRTHFPILYQMLKISQADQNFEWLIYILCVKQFEFVPYLYESVLKFVDEYLEHEEYQEGPLYIQKVLYSLKIIADALNKDHFSQTLLQVILNNSQLHLNNFIRLSRHQEKDIKKQAVVCLYRVICFSKQTAQIAYKVITSTEWYQLFDHLLYSKSPKIRAYTIQIVNNLVCADCLYDEAPLNFLRRLLIMEGTQKTAIKVEISYYIYNYLETKGDSDKLQFKDFSKIFECIQNFHESSCHDLQNNARDIHKLLTHPILLHKYPYLSDLLLSGTFREQSFIEETHMMEIDEQ